jgi:Ca-activated chloride channel family protein
MSEAFHFLRPAWLLALLPLLALGFYWLRHPPRYNPWQEQVDEHLLRHLVLQRHRLSRLPLTLLLIAWLLAVLALAGPTWSRHTAMQFRPAVPPLVIVLDLSRSMDAADLRPSRLTLAQSRLRQLLERLPPRPVGLVVFAAQAHSVMPLTEDAVLIISLLDDLETGLMPLQGSNPVAGLSLGQELLRRGGMKRGDLLLVTDGAGPETAVLARRLAEEGTTLTVYAPATPGGGPIPDGEGFLSSAGDLVQPALEGATLLALAENGGGRYIPYARDGSDLGMLITALDRPLSVAEGLPQGQGESWREEGPWLLLLLLPLALLAFRPGWEARGAQLSLGGARAGVATALLVLALQLPTAEALEWADLWWRADQQEARALREGRAESAKVLMNDMLWRGIMHYRKGEYELAASAFSGLDDPMAHYNRGNALVQLGLLQTALGAYERTLQMEPEHKHARYNRDLVQEELRRLAKEEPAAEPDFERPEGDELRDGMREEEKVAPYVEDYLEPDEGKLKTEVPDVPGPDEAPGTLGGGAILLKGEEDKEGREGPSVGQSADEGATGEREDEAEVSRAGRTPGQAQPRVEDEEEQQEASQLPSEEGVETEERRTGGGLSPEGRATASQDEQQGQSEQDAGAEDSPPEGLVEAMREPSQLASTLARQGLDEELKQALEQWLNRIPDEPAGLLREKFLREYRRSRDKPVGLDPW